jgi:hypothetical protein
MSVPADPGSAGPDPVGAEPAEPAEPTEPAEPAEPTEPAEPSGPGPAASARITSNTMPPTSAKKNRIPASPHPVKAGSVHGIPRSTQRWWARSRLRVPMATAQMRGWSPCRI